MGFREFDDTEREIAPPTETTRETSKEYGDRVEAMAAEFLVNVEQHELLTQHHEGSRPQGIDLETLSPEGNIQITEVKGTHGAQTNPRMSDTIDDVQMSDTWIENRSGVSSQVSFEGPARESVDAKVVFIDTKDDHLTTWEVDSSGRVDTSPSEIYTLGDVVSQDDE